jgi:uncharacterized membrane protein
MGTLENLGPVQMMTLAFPGSRFKGEILPELDRLKRKHVVRVLDLLLVRKDRDGNVMVSQASDLDWEEATAFGEFVGGLAGLTAGGVGGVERGAMIGAAELADGHVFDDDDIFRVTQVLADDTSAVLILVEHTWAKPLLAAVERAGGIELMNEWVSLDEVLTLHPQPPTT